MTDEAPNKDQETYWNDHAGRTWAALHPRLDAQLRPLGIAAMDRLALTSGARVLDVGCGAGETTVELATRHALASVLGVDISAPLLESARARAAAGNIDKVQFQLGDAQTYAFEAASFDAVFSRFGVMFFADPVAAFANLLRATRPAGRLGFVCWRPINENPTFTLPIEAALPFLPEPPAPTVPFAPGPFAFADGARTKGLLEAAGWVDVEVWAHDAPLLVGGGAAFGPPPRADLSTEERGLEAAVDMSLHIGPLGRALLPLDESVREGAREAVRKALRAHVGPAGVTLASATWLVTARAPSPER